MTLLFLVLALLGGASAGAVGTPSSVAAPADVIGPVSGS
jgi:hypothetical protein